MKKNNVFMILFTASVLCIFLTGCKPPNIEKYVEVENSETAFVIDLESSSQAQIQTLEILRERQVNAKRINIPRRWHKKGRLWFDGEWIDRVRVLKVDRSPVTRTWSPDATTGTSSKDEAIWVESSDSIGFAIGFNCTATIEDDEAYRFLYHYKGDNLSVIMDEQIRNEIQSVAAREAANYPMDECRTKKNNILEAVIKDVIPKYKDTGITITMIGMFGGFYYDSMAIQESIDGTFIAQQEKVTALAALDAQASKNKVIEMEAEGRANAAASKAEGEARAAIIKAEAEAQSIELVIEALNKAQDSPAFMQLRHIEIEKQKYEKWNGEYPQWYMGSEGQGFNLLIEPPK